ncbi:hypothetical protein [Salinicola endophyticus]|uniref:Uncharacterized protein n=1 Tax=Salinicola endophyticus TaxID=1949083 RepID=A0AB74U9X2_9GAMM
MPTNAGQIARPTVFVGNRIEVVEAHWEGGVVVYIFFLLLMIDGEAGHWGVGKRRARR